MADCCPPAPCPERGCWPKAHLPGFWATGGSGPPGGASVAAAKSGRQWGIGQPPNPSSHSPSPSPLSSSPSAPLPSAHIPFPLYPNPSLFFHPVPSPHTPPHSPSPSPLSLLPLPFTPLYPSPPSLAPPFPSPLLLIPAHLPSLPNLCQPFRVLIPVSPYRPPEGAWFQQQDVPTPEPQKPAASAGRGGHRVRDPLAPPSSWPFEVLPCDFSPLHSYISEPCPGQGG